MLKKLINLFSISDLILAFTFLMIISIMLLPVPSWALDILMVLNIAASVTVLLVSMYLSHPLDFAAFPSLLLVLTLYRLSINVASTKLILALGPDFDGEVVIALQILLREVISLWGLSRLLLSHWFNSWW